MKPDILYSKQACQGMQGDEWEKMTANYAGTENETHIYQNNINNILSCVNLQSVLHAIQQFPLACVSYLRPKRLSKPLSILQSATFAPAIQNIRITSQWCVFLFDTFSSRICLAMSRSNSFFISSFSAYVWDDNSRVQNKRRTWHTSCFFFILLISCWGMKYQNQHTHKYGIPRVPPYLTWHGIMPVVNAWFDHDCCTSLPVEKKDSQIKGIVYTFSDSTKFSILCHWKEYKKKQ